MFADLGKISELVHFEIQNEWNEMILKAGNLKRLTGLKAYQGGRKPVNSQEWYSAVASLRLLGV